MNNNMYTLSIYFLLFIPLFPSEIIADKALKKVNLIDSTCVRTHNSKLCKGVLESEPRDSHIDVIDLAGMVISMALENTTYIQHLIGRMIIAKEDQKIDQCLRDCYHLYGQASNWIEDSLPALEAGNYKDVRTWVTSAMIEVETCEEGFKSKTGRGSPMSAMARMFTQLCTVGLAITKLLGSTY